MSDCKQQLACLYTKNKTQKRKIWQDGRLVLNTKSLKAVLHDATPPQGSGDPSLGECEITLGQAQAILQKYNVIDNDKVESLRGTTLETERYLIEIEGPWTNVSPSTLPTRSLNNGKNVISTSMKKLLTSKYKRPKSYIPPPPGIQTSRVETFLGKRRRPLQPGELIAKHYGGAGFSAGSTRGGADDQRRNSSISKLQLQHDPECDNRQEKFGRTDDENKITRPDLFCLERHLFQQKDQQQSISHEEQTIRTEVPFRPLYMPNISGGSEDCRRVDSAPFRPQSRNAQRYRYRHPNNQPNCNAGSFVRNEFDPAKFYGVDGEKKFDERKEALIPPSQETLVRTLPQSSHALTLVDERKGEEQNLDMDMNVNYNQSNDDQSDGGGSKALDGDAFQMKDGIHREEENPFRNHRHQLSMKLNRTFSNNNNCQSHHSSMVTVKQHRGKKNDGKLSNSISINQSSSRINLQLQPKYNEFKSCHADQERHLLKVLDNENEESEREDDSTVDNHDGVPSTFRLEPIGSFASANKNKKDTKSKLLALFGADASKHTYHKNSNVEMTEVIEPNNASNIVNDDSQKQSRLICFAEREDEQGKLKNIVNGKIDGKRNKSDCIIKDSNRANVKKVGEGQYGDRNCGTRGFYLASAATSSEESSDDNSDED